MAKAQNMRRARWTCPTCANTVLAPTRPRVDDTRRYCLTCSEKKGRLVRRTAPALEKARLMRLEVRKVGKAAGRRAEEAARAAYYTVAGLDLRVEMANMTKALVFKVPHGHRGTLQSHPPTLRVRRHSAVPKTRFGCAREGRWEIMIASYPGVTAHDVRETLLHELAHLHVGCAEQHGPQWRSAFRVACEQVLGVRPRLEVRWHGEVTKLLAAAESKETES